MSVIEVVRISCKAGKGDEFKERLKRGLGVQAKDPECLSIWFQRCVERPDEFLLHLVWTSLAAHDAWRAAHRDEWRSHIIDLIEGLPNLIGHFQTVAEVKKG